MATSKEATSQAKVAAEPAPADGKKEEEETLPMDEGLPATIGYWGMYRYANGRQWALTIIGCIMSCLNGASLPGFALLFGE